MNIPPAPMLAYICIFTIHTHPIGLVKHLTLIFYHLGIFTAGRVANLSHAAAVFVEGHRHGGLGRSAARKAAPLPEFRNRETETQTETIGKCGFNGIYG